MGTKNLQNGGPNPPKLSPNGAQEGVRTAKKIKKNIDIETMLKLGLISKNDNVKILGRGSLKASLKVSAHKFSSAAKSAIENAGGEVIVI